MCNLERQLAENGDRPQDGTCQLLIVEATSEVLLGILDGRHADEKAEAGDGEAPNAAEEFSLRLSHRFGAVAGVHVSGFDFRQRLAATQGESLTSATVNIVDEFSLKLCTVSKRLAEHPLKLAEACVAIAVIRVDELIEEAEVLDEDGVANLFIENEIILSF